MAQSNPEPDDFGVLLGWRADPAGDRISLKLQSTRKPVEKSADVRDYRYFMTKQQAVQLGNYLYGLAGETPPVQRKRGFFARIFGG